MLSMTKRPGMYKRCLAAALIFLLCLLPAFSLAEGTYAAVTGDA